MRCRDGTDTPISLNIIYMHASKRSYANSLCSAVLEDEQISSCSVGQFPYFILRGSNTDKICLKGGVGLERTGVEGVGLVPSIGQV